MADGCGGNRAESRTPRAALPRRIGNPPEPDKVRKSIEPLTNCRRTSASRAVQPFINAQEEKQQHRTGRQQVSRRSAEEYGETCNKHSRQPKAKEKIIRRNLL